VTDDPLIGCRLKLQQAQRHLWDLQAEVDQFQESDRDPTPPLHLGVIVGDFLHNLRCGLDHLVWQLVILNGSQPTRSHQFPICDTEGEFRGKADRQLRYLAARQVETIASFQPYRLGREAKMHSLAVLRDLSNIDKHQFVHASAVIGDVETSREVVFTDLNISFAALWRLNLYMNYTVHEAFARFFPLPPHVAKLSAEVADETSRGSSPTRS
jgi:hypothetical protein